MLTSSLSFGCERQKTNSAWRTADLTTRWIHFKSKQNWMRHCTALHCTFKHWKRAWHISLSPCPPGRSWVRRKSTTCWWPPASIRSWKRSEKSFTTACWRRETSTVSSLQVGSLPLFRHAPTQTWQICYFNLMLHKNSFTLGQKKNQT